MVVGRREVDGLEQANEGAVAALQVANSPGGHGLVQQPWHSQAEGGDGRFELLAIRGPHAVAALHGAHGRIQHGAAAVTETLARVESWLLAYHAIAAHFFHLAVRIGDDPVT